MSDVSKVKPAPGYMLIKPEEQEQKTASGLYIPKDEDKKPQRGTVVSIGDVLNDKEPEKVPAKVGDVVVYKKWAGNDFEHASIKYQILEFGDIIATIER